MPETWGFTDTEIEAIRAPDLGGNTYERGIITAAQRKLIKDMEPHLWGLRYGKDEGRAEIAYFEKLFAWAKEQP